MEKNANYQLKNFLKKIVIWSLQFNVFFFFFQQQKKNPKAALPKPEVALDTDQGGDDSGIVIKLFKFTMPFFYFGTEKLLINFSSPPHSFL